MTDSIERIRDPSLAFLEEIHDALSDKPEMLAAVQLAAGGASRLSGSDMARRIQRVLIEAAFLAEVFDDRKSERAPSLISQALREGRLTIEQIQEVANKQANVES
ncbi:hypothetical protein HY969_02015 [Candidatus Kaiserbacteria bacterium]|nr:hypothetical protein [Candidatus Kaiserbacteria bacterium]